MLNYRPALFFIIAFMFTGAATAETADEIRGGWVADIDGTRHIYIVQIIGSDVTGTYCWDCSNPDNLAFIREGTFKDGKLDFTVFHDQGESTPYLRSVHAELANGKLVETSQRQAADKVSEIVFERQGRVAPRAALDLPDVAPSGPGEQLSNDSITGLWFSRAGMGARKQYLMFREVEGEILGLVCGPCDNVHNMAPIYNVSFTGSKLYIEIAHEDVGTEDGLNNAPFYNTVDVIIVDNEFYLESLTNNDPPGTAPFKMMFTGPVK